MLTDRQPKNRTSNAGVTLPLSPRPFLNPARCSKPGTPLKYGTADPLSVGRRAGRRPVLSPTTQEARSETLNLGHVLSLPTFERREHGHLNPRMAVEAFRTHARRRPFSKLLSPPARRRVTMTGAGSFLPSNRRAFTASPCGAASVGQDFLQVQPVFLQVTR